MRYNYNLTAIFIFLLSGCVNKTDYQITNTLRAPAYPLINIDPYTNAWSFGDLLYEHDVTHWTGKAFPLVGAIRVDGKTYRFMGREKINTIPIAATAAQTAWVASYILEEPSTGWEKTDFNDCTWKKSQAAFGVMRAENIIHTPWTTEHIWVRREIHLDEDYSSQSIYLDYSHDDDIEIYINGIEVLNTGNICADEARIKLPENVVETLKKGKNVIAAHCHNRQGDAILDFGISAEIPVSCNMEHTAIQKSVEVLPTQTIYAFTCGPVNLKITFTAPLLMNNLDLLSRPVNYISYEIKSNDKSAHTAELYLEANANWALDRSSQEFIIKTFEKNNLLFLKTGSKAQHILEKKGDDEKIDWGHFYLAADKNDTEAMTGGNSLRIDFCETGRFKNEPPPFAEKKDVLALCRSLGKIDNPITGYFMLGYDDIYSIQYFGNNLRPYWNRNEDNDILSLFNVASKEYNSLIEACNKFDKELMREAAKCGGKKYAELCALAYRQTISAHKLVEAPGGELLFLSKQNQSRGAIATVDISFPSAPLFLLYNVELAKGLLNPIFYYVEYGGWDHPFAPHDAGLYPIANGMITKLEMPVEESANMLIMTAAISTIERNAMYAEKHWKSLTLWADYLLKNGFDPENQNFTDIFSGMLAHNTNLSIKAILGIASYGRLADMLGKNDIAQRYTSKARAMAQTWMKLADDGDHYRLAFDQPGTWSQKYNLVWDKIIKMNIFPHEVAEKEVAYYLSKQLKYGLPLDSRRQYTKADWIVWSATLSPNVETFQQFISSLYAFVNETTDRIPMSDWYWTDKPEHAGFQARSVVGGFYIKMLENKLIAEK
ncbi:MAG: DUF4965 domain-containing protein [Tannerella sp.]|jgi:hypothetical protein|nr:DUF4965 domain-containing protein [Tannerella sp.]